MQSLGKEAKLTVPYQHIHSAGLRLESQRILLNQTEHRGNLNDRGEGYKTPCNAKEERSNRYIAKI